MRIGDSLIENALSWLDAEGAAAKIVEVGTGNEQAFGFYSRYGFLPRKTTKTSEKMINKDSSLERLLSLIKSRIFNS